MDREGGEDVAIGEEAGEAGGGGGGAVGEEEAEGGTEVRGVSGGR